MKRRSEGTQLSWLVLPDELPSLRRGATIHAKPIPGPEAPEPWLPAGKWLLAAATQQYDN